MNQKIIFFLKRNFNFFEPKKIFFFNEISNFMNQKKFFFKQNFNFFEPKNNFFFSTKF